MQAKKAMDTWYVGILIMLNNKKYLYKWCLKKQVLFEKYKNDYKQKRKIYI